MGAAGTGVCVSRSTKFNERRPLFSAAALPGCRNRMLCGYRCDLFCAPIENTLIIFCNIIIKSPIDVHIFWAFCYNINLERIRCLSGWKAGSLSLVWSMPTEGLHAKRGGENEGDAFWYHKADESITETVSAFIRSANAERYGQMQENITDLASIVMRDRCL